MELPKTSIIQRHAFITRKWYFLTLRTTVQVVKYCFTQPYRELNNKHKNDNKFLQIENKESNKIGKDPYKGEIEPLRGIQEKDNIDNIFERLKSSKKDII